MRNILILSVVGLLFGCSSRREVSIPEKPHVAPKIGSKYSRIIYTQRTVDSAPIPPRAGAPSKPPATVKKEQPIVSDGSDVSSEDCPGGQCQIQKRK